MKPDFLFIVGCNRSGTSLLRQIFNRSASVCLAPETHFLRRLSRVGVNQTLRQFGDLSIDRNIDRLVSYLYTDHFALKISYWQWLKHNVARETLTRTFLATDRSERALFLAMMRVYAEFAKPGHADLILGEKTPTHLYYVPTLLEWFPRAKVIQTMRDPRAIIVSKLKKVNRKTSRDGFLKRLDENSRRMMEPFADPLEVAHTGKAWLDAAHLDEKYARDFPEQYRLLRFEDLIADPKANVNSLCEWLEIPYEAAMLEEIHVVASSFESQHRSESGIDTRALERWKEVSHPLVNAGFELFGQQQMKRFGYVPYNASSKSMHNVSKNIAK